jgi:xanthine dehydrogenase accessory factor
MKLGDLTLLNQARAARKPAVLITDLSSGQQRAVTADGFEADPLAQTLAAAVARGRSMRVEVSGRDYFLTVQVPSVRLVVLGAVHISQALVPFARELELDLTIVDPRTAFATPERFPSVPLIAEWPDVALPGLNLDPYTAFIALTHDPKIDDPGLEIALAAGCFYVGALGSRKTHARRVERLSAKGVDLAAIARIHAPIGLDIGAVSPAEIALSIMGELVAAMRLTGAKHRRVADLDTAPEAA